MRRKLKQSARDLLESANLRRTAPRINILSILLGAAGTLTAEEIAVKLGRAAPNKVTIYRVLENFIEAGLVHKVFVRKKNWHFELSRNCTQRQCHPHFTCTDCDKTYCLTEMTFPMAKSPYPGFVIHRQRVQLEGLCQKCTASP